MNQKMSKKLLACLLAAMMGLTVLAGCSEQKEQPKEEPAQQTQETQPEAQTASSLLYRHPLWQMASTCCSSSMAIRRLQ